MKARNIILLLVLALELSVNAQDSLLSKKDFIIISGLSICNRWDEYSYETRHNIEFNLGMEYFIIPSISSGIELDFSIERIKRAILDDYDYRNKKLYGDFYTTFYLGFYTKQLFYLKPSFTLHKNITDRAYPLSYSEYRYSLGFGKRVILAEHITVYFETNISRFNEHVKDSDGNLLNNYGIILSFTTGIQIVF